MFEFSEEQIRALLLGIYTGSITPYSLPQSLYYAIADYLKKGLYQGFGGGLSDYAVGSKDFELLSELRENVYMFSGAKTYQQMRVMSGLLAEGEQIMPFPDFRNAARQVFDTFNTTWLQTEYNTAIGQAQCAVKWQSIIQRADVLPVLEYEAVMDPNTSDICRPLNGVRLPVNDPFWKKFAPLNHFNCRCLIKQLTEGEFTPKKDIQSLEKSVADQMQDIFKMNPGVEKVIYSENHPYFDVPKKDKAYAKNNFNLPIPKNDGVIHSTPILEPKPALKPKIVEAPKEIPLTPEEAVKKYTEAWAYGKVQGYLRKGYVDEFKGYVDELISGMDKYLDTAPKYDGVVYRGLAFENKDTGFKELINAIKKKGELFDKGYMSTSADRGVTSYFLDKPGQHTVLFEIEGKSGISISHLSSAPGEKEVIFKRGSKFKVVSYEESEQYAGGPKHYNVKLKEI